MHQRGWILIVDDDEDIRDALALVLQTCGYRTVTAFDGEDALHRLRENGPPALVLLDLMMPRMNGVDFAKAMHAHTGMRDVPIVVLSGDSAGVQTAASMRATYLAKPVDLQTLLDVVEALAPRGATS
jgi:CheY-like chemotaxis protein